MLKKQQEKNKFQGLFLLVPYLKQYKSQIFLVILALLTTSFMVLFLGKVVKYLIDYGFIANDTKNLNLTLIGFLFCVVILAIAGYFRSSLINQIGEKIVANIRQKAYRHIIFSPKNFFEDKKIGDVISRLTVDTTLLYNIISNSISFLLRNILLFVGGVVFLFLSSTKLTLIALILLPLAILPIIILGKKVKNLSKKTQEKVALLSSHIEESINGIQTIQAYQNEHGNSNNFNELSQETLKTSIAKIKIRALLVSLIILIAFSFVGLVIWLGSFEVINNKMSGGDLSSFVFYAIISATSLVAIAQVMGQLQTASGAASRIFELLQTKSDIKEAKKPIKLPKNVLNGQNLSLEFKNVNFAYQSDKKHKILDNFSLKINNKEKIALVGESGKGKSTILQLLMRFIDVDKGKILINEKYDIKNLSLKDLRSLFAYISQDFFIFSGTILENIKFGNQKVTKKDVEELINSNKAFDFIKKMPNGINSHVGQKGVKLSGGEKQRIAILRAIVNNSPILLLDEATSALDKNNEKLVNNLINHLMADKIVILIAHKLEETTNIDRIISL